MGWIAIGWQVNREGMALGREGKGRGWVVG